MIQPGNKTEGLLQSITKNCETLIQQTHTEPQETIEFKLNKSRETLPFNPPIQIKRDWMVGLTSLEIYNFYFNITEDDNKLELYKIPDEKSGDVSYKKIRHEIERDLDI